MVGQEFRLPWAVFFRFLFHSISFVGVETDGLHLCLECFEAGGCLSWHCQVSVDRYIY